MLKKIIFLLFISFILSIGGVRAYKEIGIKPIPPPELEIGYFCSDICTISSLVTTTYCQSGTYCAEKVTSLGKIQTSCVQGRCKQLSECNGQGQCVNQDTDYDGYAPPDDCNNDNYYINPGRSETCNGIDDNCDGVIDFTSQTCGYNTKGVCNLGTQTCTNGVLGSCIGARMPTSEICDDGLDNDCDGLTDSSDITCLKIDAISSEYTQVKDTSFQVFCTPSITNTDCIGARVQNENACTFLKWESGKATFSCTPKTAGLAVVECYASNKADGTCRLYNSNNALIDTGTPQTSSKTKDIRVISSVCSERSESECLSEASCEWCDACSNQYSSPILDKNSQPKDSCVPKDTCQTSYSCKGNSCGAECDADATGCSATDCSSMNGCYNTQWQKDQTTIQGWVSYGDGSYKKYTCGDSPNSCQLLTCSCTDNACSSDPSEICTLSNTDSDSDGFDIECGGDCNDNSADVYPGAPEICDNIPDNNCDGIAEESKACCGSVDSDNLNMQDNVITNAKDETIKDKARDYYWGGDCNTEDCALGEVGQCAHDDYVDECYGNVVVNGNKIFLKEYYAQSNSYSYEIKECPVFCTGKTTTNFKATESLNYAPGCSDGACVSETISDTCSDQNTLVEYYCSGNLLKSVEKKCDDFDGFYDSSGGETEYRDYSCSAGACTYDSSIVNNDLNHGQAKIKFKNMGSVPFKGTLHLSVNSFCTGLDNIIITDELNVPVHGFYEKIHDFLTKCSIVDYEFICSNQLNYGVTCVWGVGSGCGALTKESEIFESCDTCCGVVLDGSEYESACESQNTKCETSMLSLEITDSNAQIQASTTINNAAWCCK